MITIIQVITFILTFLFLFLYASCCFYWIILLLFFILSFLCLFLLLLHVTTAAIERALNIIYLSLLFKYYIINSSKLIYKIFSFSFAIVVGIRNQPHQKIQPTPIINNLRNGQPKLNFPPHNRFPNLNNKHLINNLKSRPNFLNSPTFNFHGRFLIKLPI